MGLTLYTWLFLGLAGLISAATWRSRRWRGARVRALRRYLEQHSRPISYRPHLLWGLNDLDYDLAFKPWSDGRGGPGCALVATLYVGGRSVPCRIVALGRGEPLWLARRRFGGAVRHWQAASPIELQRLWYSVA